MPQLEKLLQKNFFLHQSAKDGYRAYLQSYASYSLKKIFDVNKLDLAKVGKAFGFAVPPRVNISVGGGKRKREDESEDEADEWKGRARGGKGSREREDRIERLGKRKVEKEVFRSRNKTNWVR